MPVSRNWDEFHRKMKMMSNGSLPSGVGMGYEEPIETTKSWTPVRASKQRAEFLLRRCLSRLRRLMEPKPPPPPRTTISGGVTLRSVTIGRMYPVGQGSNMLEFIVFELSQALQEDRGLADNQEFLHCAETIQVLDNDALRPPFREFLQAVLRKD